MINLLEDKIKTNLIKIKGASLVEMNNELYYAFSEKGFSNSLDMILVKINGNNDVIYKDGKNNDKIFFLASFDISCLK